MAGFPPLEYPRTLYKTIMERDSYIVIFRELMRKVKIQVGFQHVVTGNPGTGKSRFYLYCIFQLIRCHRVEVQELSSFELVLNCNNNFQVYQPDTKEFVYLGVADVKELMTRGRVLRLTDGTRQCFAVGMEFQSCLLPLTLHA
ncbi:hypothetical protein GQ600_23201 [Phytophthora cactorum]|nr:hypothetical protein GQ600_23201 [Phytophthora cactorum]